MQSTTLKTNNKDKDRAKKNNRQKKNKKTNIKNAFFLCFQPVTMDGPVNQESEYGGDGDPRFKYISVKDKDDGVVFPTMLPDSSSSPSVDNKSAAATPRKKKFGHRSFSNVLKALLFEASLIKKLRERKLREKLNRAYPNSSAKAVKNSKPPSEISISNNQEESTNGRRSISNASLSLGSSSVIAASTSSRCSLCGSALPNRNNSNKSSFRLSSLQDNVNSSVQKQVKGYYGVNFGLYLVVLSLLVLVFWGKACAIFCTSTWLFCVPLRNIRSDSRNGYTSEFDSEQYKKKIIMEGLLDRNHIRSL